MLRVCVRTQFHPHLLKDAPGTTRGVLTNRTNTKVTAMVLTRGDWDRAHSEALYIRSEQCERVVFRLSLQGREASSICRVCLASQKTWYNLNRRLVLDERNTRAISHTVNSIVGR